jgi:glycosyltransferase involved in cell wall biosynthesis
LRVIIIHNQYQRPGGEDKVCAAETTLLEANGHQVLRYTVHNETVKLHGKFALALKTIWNQTHYQELRRLFQRKKPNLVHVHNTLPLISPAVYHAAQSEGIVVCLTLHNYRLLCPNALFFRNDMVCEDCIGRFLAWPGIRNACYRRSRPTTIVVSFMNSFHRLLGTWKNKIDVYIALTEFSKQKFIQAGFPKNKIVVKPNFVENGSYFFGTELAKKRVGALFVGRLSREKGIETLLKAWKIIGRSFPLKIIGDGPLASFVRNTVSARDGIFLLGQRPILEVYDLMAKASILVFPSECYETFGRVAMESFSQGTPVISSNIGAMAEMINHGHTGLHFETGNFQDLADKVLWANEHPNEMERMGRNARREYEAKYTPERNYQMLMSIYELAAKNQGRIKSGVRLGHS